MSWLWQSRDLTVIKIDSIKDAARVLDEFDETGWELAGQPRPGLAIYRRATWWTRFGRWFGWSS